MWRTALFLTAVFLVAPELRAQISSREPPRLTTGTGTTSFRQSAARSSLPPPVAAPRPPAPAMPTVTPLVPLYGQHGGGLPGAPAMPVVTPSAPFLNQPGVAMPGAAPAPPPPRDAADPGPERATNFDPNLAELQWRDNRWQLWSGNVFLKDFGRHDAEGREVVRLIRELRFDALATIGAPRPVMEYWLSNGEAPRAAPPGMRTIPIDQATLRTEQVQGQWCLRDAQRIFFAFGADADAARQALAAVRRHGFNQVGYVGQVAPVMLVFLATPAPRTASQVVAQTRNQPRMRETLFPRRHPASADARANGDGAARPFPQQAQTPPAVPNPPSPTFPGAPTNPAGPITPVSLTPPAAPTVPGTATTTGARDERAFGNGINHPRMPGAPIPGFAPPGERLPFDARQLQTRRDAGDWKLASGNVVLANFGPSEADARLAQAALRYYRCTEQVHVGRPRPSLSYFLANGKAPRGSMLGLNGVSFRPEMVQVRQLGNSYVVWDGTQVVMSFGDRANDAQEVVQAIQHHRFDRLYRIGHGDRGLTLLAQAN